MKGMRRFIALALQQYGDAIVDPLPCELLQTYRLVSKRDAIRAIHMPLSHEQLKQARRRLVYEEFLLFQLKMQALKNIAVNSHRALHIAFQMNSFKRLFSRFHFRSRTHNSGLSVKLFKI